MDTVNCIADVWYRLGFLSAADLAAATGPITPAQLYQYADDAAKFLARSSSLFLSYDDSVDVIAATAVYALPTGHVFTEGAWLLYSGLPPQLLRLSTVGQLFALDGNWSSTAGDPSRLSLDAGAANTGTLYPIPISDATLAQIMQAIPATVTADSSTLPVSAVLQDYFSDAMIAGARSSESDSAMPEVAAHLRERMKLYEATMRNLWGAGR
jgi:hypothetical protein